MTITRNINGSYTVTDIVNGYLVSKTYCGYTRKECASKFRQLFPSKKQAHKQSIANQTSI